MQGRNIVMTILPALLATLVVGLVGCGSNQTLTTNPMAASPNSASLQLRVGDAPSDSIVAFEIKVDSITLTNSSNTSVSLLSAPTEIELTHTAGTVEPLVISSVPPGTYTQATITLSDPEVTIIDSTGQPKEVTATLTSPTATVTFNPAITFDASSHVLSFDLDLAQSVTLTASGATITPLFTASTAPVAQAGEQEDDENGEVEDLHGSVTSVGSSSFMISALNQAINVGSQTQFEGVTGLSALKNGMMVEVDAITQSDGSLLATKVEAEVENEAGNEVEDVLGVEGLVTSTTGAPVTQFQMIAGEVEGSGTPAPALGSTITVNVDANTKFAISQDKVDLSNLSFSPTFDATQLGKVQAVEADTDVASATLITARRVKLKQQGLTGTVSNIVSGSGGQQTFTLTVASDSAFAMLTGGTTLTVVQQSTTELKGISGVTANQTVRVRGLLFFNGGAYQLVAARIAAP
jgi:uncharacterized protein DUF5666/uncharacterized protein DUF4382